MVVWLIRHGQSHFNSGTMSSEYDKNVSLNDFGIEQSKRLNFHFNLLVLSPMKRAIQTYSSSNIKATDIVIDHGVREHKCSHPNLMDHESDVHFETEEEFNIRVERTLEKLKTMDKPDINIGVITHHGFIQRLTYLLGKPVSLGNACYVRLELQE